MDAIDILHRIAFDVEDEKLDALTRSLRKQTEEIYNLGKRQSRLAELYNKTSSDEVARRQKILSLMDKNKTAMEKQAKATEDVILNNKQYNDQLVKELGLIGSINAKLQILEERRKKATSKESVQSYNRLINEQKGRLNELNERPQQSGIFARLSNNGLGASMGVASRLLPAIGGAFALTSLSSQIVDVTKKFEGYIQTLKNAYGSSVKADIAFSKLQQFASKTPYSVDELTSSFIKLKNRGFDPTMAEMTKMGDIASSQGKSFDQLVEAILDGQVGEFERLKEFGIKAKTAGDTVTLSFKGVEKQVKKTDEEGLRNAILSFGELQGVMGGMAGASTTLNGKLSNLGDTTDMLLFTLSKSLGVDSLLGSLVDLANEALGAMKDLLDNSIELAGQAKRDAEAGAILVAEYEKLEKQTRLTADEKDRMLMIQNDLVNVFGDSILMIDKETGAYRLNKEAVKDLIRQKMLLANSEASSLALKITEKKEVIEKKKKQLSLIEKTQFAYMRQDGKAEGDIAYMMENRTINNYEGKNREKIIKLEKEKRKLIEEIGKRGKTKTSFFSGFGYTEGDRGLEGEVGEDLGAFGEFGFKESDLNVLSKFTIPPDKPTTKTDKPTRTATNTPNSQTKKQPKKQPKQVDYISIAENKKLKEEEIRNAEYIKLQEDLFAKEEITALQKHNRLERNEMLHQSKMLNIKIEFNKKREKSIDNLSEIAQDESALSELQNKIKELTDKFLKSAIDDFNKFNEEKLQLIDDADQLEIERLKSQHSKKMEELDRQIKEEKDKLVDAEEQKNTALADQYKKNIEELTAIKKATFDKNADELKNKEVSQEVAKNDSIFKMQIDALESLTEQKRAVFKEDFKNQQQKITEEINSIKSKNEAIEHTEVKSNRKKLKLKEEFDRNERILQINKKIASLLLSYEQESEGIKILENSGQRKTKIEEDSRKKQIAEKRQTLDEIIKNVKSSEEEKKQLLNNKVEEEKLEGYKAIADETISAINTVNQALQNQVEQEISIQERRVESAKEIAERGNAEALQEEEKKLDSAMRIKERFAKREMAINLVQQASALTLAIAKAASTTTFPANLVAIASVISALASGFATVKQMSTPAFKDGVIDFQGKGTSRSDSNLVRISRHESVINAEATRRNKEILTEINNGKVFSMMDFKSPEIRHIGQTIDISPLETRLIRVEEAIREKTPNSITIDKRGLIAITEQANEVNRRRDLL